MREAEGECAANFTVKNRWYHGASSYTIDWGFFQEKSNQDSDARTAWEFVRVAEVEHICCKKDEDCCWTCSYDKMVVVQAKFDPFKSYRSPRVDENGDEQLLRHEKYHLRLAEAVLCTAAKKFDSGATMSKVCEKDSTNPRQSAIERAKISWTGRFKTVWDKMLATSKELNETYDQQSDHSLNPIEQDLWERNIDRWRNNCDVPLVGQ